jgi:hypothetical protein
MEGVATQRRTIEEDASAHPPITPYFDGTPRAQSANNNGIDLGQAGPGTKELPLHASVAA